MYIIFYIYISIFSKKIKSFLIFKLNFKVKTNFFKKQN